ncbi:AAA family ATPase [Pseudomonas costantinii]|uniref:AAA family ATPase n=1 Tax=Pseudomonas TaxID=286 RepID=UPI0015A10FA0|nr:MULTISPECIES: AAA family ATPase [Pseudomonas]NVZ22680.1 AAA family ATPase [Pseudomonas costantinii]WLH27459.1 AAA family ATPase [Pseudomonas canadensis]
MKALININPSPEQMTLFARPSAGVEVIRGAAGSGKTTTALLKLRSSAGFYLNRVRKLPPEKQEKVNILVLTFNRTLRGYIAELTERQFVDEPLVNLDFYTFNKWAKELTGAQSIINIKATAAHLNYFAGSMKLDQEFVIDEAMYVLGRFEPDKLDDYLTARRDGRGITPRMEKPARQRLLDEVIRPYNALKHAKRMVDWNDLAAVLSSKKMCRYDVIVVDETQDFSANEIRAVLNQRSDDATVTFVLDSAQRIYSRNFTWTEVGVTLRPEKSSTLQTNYRNTQEIAHFASALLSGITLDDNGTMPNFDKARSNGVKPIVLLGDYLNQVRYAVDYIRRLDLQSESVAFLHPKIWFRDLKPRLLAQGLEYVELTGDPKWPQGSENIALCSVHSSKGLEFDHVIMIGLDGSILDVSAVDEDGEATTDDYELSARLRRLIAMGIGRARESVILGFKPSDTPDIMRFVPNDLYTEVKV